MITDWDDAYQNAAYIPDAADFVPLWQQKAAAFRAAYPPVQIPYGPHPRQFVDLFLPPAPKGLLVFVHGGYWRSFDRQDWSHLAKGAMARGIAVAIPGYVLCPEHSIAQISTSIAKAIDTVAKSVSGPIHLTGHSAGGHLVCRIGCRDIDLACAVRLKTITSISGLHDLRPLVNTGMNADLRLTDKTATQESPAFKTPRKGFDFTAWVGAKERPEFLRQNQLIANIWTSCGINTKAIEDPDQNHFTVINGLEHTKSPLLNAVFDVNQGP